MRLKLIVMNILYVAASVVAILMFFFKPYIDAGVTYKLTPDVIEKIIEPYLPDEIDAKEVVGESGVNLKLTTKITSKMGISCALSKNPLDYAEKNVIAPNVKEIAKSVQEPLVELTDNLLSTLNTVRMYSLIVQNIHEFDPLSDPTSLMNEANYTTTIFRNEIDTIGKSYIYPGLSTVDDIATRIGNKFNEIYDAIAVHHVEFIAKSTTPSEEQAIANQIKSLFGTFEMYNSSDNSIKSSINAIISTLKMATKTKSATSDSGAEPLLSHREISEAETEEFNESLYDFVCGLLEDNASQASISIRITGIVLLFMMGCWALLGIFCIIKSFFKNPGIFLGLLFYTNLIIQVVLGLVITFGLKFLPQFVGNIPVIGQTITKFVGPFTINIKTSATIPALIALGVLITGFLYGHWKRKLKEDL